MEKTHSEVVRRLYMKLLPIQILLVVTGGANAIIDNIFAGNLLGPGAMAVTGLFAPVANFLNAINVLFFGGAQLLCGKYLGRQMKEKTGSIFTLDLAAVSVISGVLILICEILPGSVCALLGASGGMVRDLSSYIRGFVVGIPFFCLGTQFTAFLQLEHQEKRSYAAIISMFFCNAFFNWLFIAVLRMGLFGLGLSTSIGNAVFCLVQAVYYLTGRPIIRFAPKSILLSDLPAILSGGLPGAITQLCIFFRGILINHIIRTYVGADGLAAFSAINSFGSVYWAVPAGVTSAVMVLGSVYAGEEDRTALKSLMATFLTRGIGLVALVSIALSASCRPLTEIFFRDPSAPVYGMTLQGFLLFPLSSIISAFIVGFSNYFRCLQYEKIVRLLSVIDGIISVSLFALLLVPRIGMTGVWLSQILGGLLVTSIILGFIAWYNKSPVLTPEKMMCFPPDFGVPDESRIDISIHSLPEVINISQTVQDFCRNHEISRRRANCASLCVEELAGNIIRYGFSDRKRHCLDIRVSYVRDDVILCLKDDCIPFDPTEASKLFDPDDITHNIGLRIATKISKSMTYQNTFGLNILTIVI